MHKGRDRFSAFCYICNPKQRKMNIRERIGTLYSRLEVEFQCLHCNLTEVIKGAKNGMGTTNPRAINRKE